ncbi:MAG: tetratricopeptide repeat protein [Acidimicrobiia bacterium]|nr:tetratricopeptide repeat protein [Acidimicrobiia bacterium]
MLAPIRFRVCALAVLGLLVAGPSPAQQQPSSEEAPVALVVRSAGGNLTREGNELSLTLRAGDILFFGDTVHAATGAVTILYCPDRALYTLPQGARAVMDPKQIQMKSGQLSEKTNAPYCYLPKIGRLTAASQMHNGASVRRALRPDADPGTFANRLAALPQDRRSALQIELDPLDKAIAANSSDPMPRLGRAEALARYGLSADAAAEYEKVAASWPDAAWLKARLFVLEEQAEKAPGSGAPAPTATAEPGKTFALLVGISKYRSTEIRPLSFAHEDAILLNEYLRSERGGKLGDTDIVLLTNEQATTAAIRNAFETFLKTAGKNDNVILLIATHGTVVETKGKRGAYIITYDSDPQDLDTTALPMADVQNLIRTDLSSVGRVMAFVDVCRSGTIGTIPENAKVNRVVEALAQTEGELFLFTASRASEFSFEGPQYGGGHGAFSFFLLEALNGSGDLNSDGNVTINELIEYTQTKVAEGTLDRQHPRENGNYEGTNTMASTKLTGIAMKKYTPTAEGGDRLALVASRGFEPTSAVVNRPRRAAVLREVVDFDEALDGGRLLPDGQRNAFTALRQIQRRVKPPEYLQEANRLKSALEDRGQQVILTYLAGDQVPQTKEDFGAGAAYFGAAKLLTPESLLLESRETFCLGRMRIFDKDYQTATQLLERAVRLDPQGAYSYNALGIASLEQADYQRAAQAFREAAKRAPLWAYPLHNLALTYTQLGSYEEAINSYREAMRLAPDYSYLPYNLGLLYQRLNRLKEAEASYRTAMRLAPNDAMAYNALGFLNAFRGKRSQAETFYRQALEKNSAMLEARHNLAVLLAERKQSAPDAIALWKENLAKSPDHLPSRLSLAKTLADSGREADAITEFQAVVQARPEYAAARLSLAQLLAKQNGPQALQQLAEVVKLQPSSSQAWELIGDLEKAAGRSSQAGEAYQKALDNSFDGSSKKRIRRKM